MGTPLEASLRGWRKGYVLFKILVVLTTKASIPPPFKALKKIKQLLSSWSEPGLKITKDLEETTKKNT